MPPFLGRFREGRAAMLRWSAYGVLVVLTLVVRLLLPSWMSRTFSESSQGFASKGSQASRLPHDGPRAPFPTPAFREVQAESDLQFQYDNGAEGRMLMVEQTGGGTGWLDYDGDRHWDLYLVQGGDPTARDRRGQPANQLYRNRGDGTFHSVTHWAGVDDRGYGQGLAVGDFDNDGFDDLYVTNVGANVLYQNMGDGTFQDLTDRAGVGDPRWSTSAAWGDLDRDGDLDLYVCNYAKYDPLRPLPCEDSSGQPTMCHPRRAEPAADECFLNEGNGTFRPVAVERGLIGNDNRALGVVIADLNNDGAPDIYVANDTTENFLFVNRGDGWFDEQAVMRGCAVNSTGSAQASMGVALGDIDHDGWWDLYLTHFSGEHDTLYYNRGPEGFQDVTFEMGLVPMTLPTLGFGTVMHDFNHDRRVDVFVTNGHIQDLRDFPEFDPRFDQLEQPPQLFTFNRASGEWFDCGPGGGNFFSKVWIGRGVASCDYDNDGDFDLCVVHHNAPAALLRNDSSDGHWLKIRLIGRVSNRNGVGARVRVTQNEETLHQELPGGTSYCSAHQSVLSFGLGERNERCRVEIAWPGGTMQALENVAVDREIVVVEQL